MNSKVTADTETKWWTQAAAVNEDSNGHWLISMFIQFLQVLSHLQH